MSAINNHTYQSLIDYSVSELSEIYEKNELNSIIKIIFEDQFQIKLHEIHLRLSEKVSEEIFKTYVKIVSRLKLHEPIQYILGKASFYNRYYNVDKNVLIPRQETEELVQWIIEEHRHNKPRILDVGTGSGCIAITLSHEIPESRVYALDVSREVLEVAIKNGNNNNADVEFFQMNILDPVYKADLQFDIIASNPPYVLNKEKEMMSKNVLNYEPSDALFVDDHDPLIFYRAILDFAVRILQPKGLLYFEINESLGKELEELVRLSYGMKNVEIRNDLNGKPRMMKCDKS